MTESEFEKVIANPYEKLDFRSDEDSYCFGEKNSYKNEFGLINGEILCSMNSYMGICGSVDLNIDIANFMEKHNASFVYLEVPRRIQNKGIGTKLMQRIVAKIKVLKEYYSINDKITVSGWLSQVDCINENWKVSTSVYEKIGKFENLDYAFMVRDTGKITKSAKEFLRVVGTSDGMILYKI